MEFTATISRRSNVRNEHFILFHNIYHEDGTLFRDHMWLKLSDRLSHLVEGDIISFGAKIDTYLSSEGEKQGLKKLRNIHRINK